MSGYYVGLLVGSLRVPTLVARVGHVRVFAALLSLGSTAILFQALFVEPVAWFLMRLMTGYCFAGAFIVAESWLNGSATNETRGSLLSLYMVVQMGVHGGGPVPAQPRRPAGLRPVHPGFGADLGRGRADAADGRGGTDRELARAISAWWRCTGSRPWAWSASPGSAPPTAACSRWDRSSPTQEGLSVASISFFMAAVILGGVAFQVPIGRLSDRMDRRWVIAAVALLTAMVASAAGVARRMLPPWTLFPGLLPGRRPVAAALCALRRAHQRLPVARSRWSAPAVP